MSEIPMIRRDNGVATVTLGPDPDAYETLRDCSNCGRTYNQFVTQRCPECGHAPAKGGETDA
jgi:ribosomal protein L37E